jgi:hypothetical protein
MPTVTELRTGLATRLGTISGLRTSATIPDQINPPLAVVSVETITYDEAFSRGLDQYTFMITLLVGRVAERSAQNSLDSYLAPTGSGSVKTAIEGDRSLGGKAQTLRVTEMSGITPVTLGDVSYLSATFMVTVYA